MLIHSLIEVPKRTTKATKSVAITDAALETDAASESRQRKLSVDSAHISGWSPTPNAGQPSHARTAQDSEPVTLNLAMSEQQMWDELDRSGDNAM